MLDDGMLLSMMINFDHEASSVLSLDSVSIVDSLAKMWTSSAQGIVD